MIDMKLSSSLLLCSALLALPACDGGKKDAPANDGKVESAAQQAATGAKAATGAEAATGDEAKAPKAEASNLPPLSRVMQYLDPEARAVLVLTKVDQFDFDPETLGTVAALPPGATRLLEAAHRANTYLDPEETGHPKWLASEMMVVTPGSGSKDYIVARRAGDEAQMKAALDELGLVLADDLEPPTWRSTKRFPFKVSKLDGDVIALISGDELGSGLDPLTAGRDLPPSEMRTELEKMLTSDANIELALHAGGPMLHLDASRDIAATQLGIRRDDASTLRAQVILQPVANPDGVAKELNERKHPEETQAVQELMKRLQFVVDKGVLVGELKLSADDLTHLE
jgi:hypothetical protein